MNQLLERQAEIQTQKERQRANDRKLEQCLEEKIGQIIPVAVHLLSHMGELEPYLYAGKMGSNYVFVHSIQEQLNGAKHILGIMGREYFTHQINDDQVDTGVRLSNSHDQYPHKNITGYVDLDQQRVLELWEAREKELKNS